MKEYKMPTPYEIARIAMDLRGREAGENPQEAIRGALALWFAAEDEIRKAKATIDKSAAELSRQARASHLPDEAELLLGKNEEDSEVFKWINENAPPDDQFKTFRNFAKAYRLFDPSSTLAFEYKKGGMFKLSVGELRDFLRKRYQERKRQATEQKAERRAEIMDGNSSVN